jgi:thiol-disulfide isomerase/thioredoxin
MHYQSKTVFVSQLITILVLVPTIYFAPRVSAEPAASTTTQPDKLPWVVFIYSRDCPVCQKVHPIIEGLQTTYKSKVHFVKLDITDDKAVQDSRKLAKSMKFDSFFALYEDSFPAVGIFSDRKKCVKELFGENTKATYTASIDAAIQKSH